MNVPKFLRLIFVAALCTFIITGGSNNVAEATEGFNVESTASENLLENVTLELVNGILREDVSNTRAIFLMDEETIGGIEILDIAGSVKRSPMKMTT